MSLLNAVSGRSVRRVSTRFLLSIFCFISLGIQAQILVTSNGFLYQQNFNSLARSGTDVVWNNNTTLPGWYAASTAGGSYATYSTSAGGVSTHGLYSYGSSTSVNGDTDRALGSLNQDASGHIAYGVLFQNTSGATMNSVTLAFTAEQWRKVSTSEKGYQRVKLSYQISPVINVTAAGITSGEYHEIPEGNLITLDTVSTTNQSMDGNATGNFASVQIILPVVFPAGQQMMIRFFDENNTSVDAAMALDDFSATFSMTVVSGITVTSDYSLTAYADQGILRDIPEAGQATYLIPSANDMSAWSGTLTEFYARNWNAVDAGDYGYDLVSFTSQHNNKSYRVLRKNNASSYFWGTYMLADNPENTSMVIQAPHPKTDALTERQATSIFQLTHAYACMVAGISRCASDSYSSCAGSTAVCGSTESFRRSDVAHEDNSIFHIATTLLAQLNTNLKFVQLHGFDQSGSEPEFIISCGLRSGLLKTGIDYPALIRENILQSGLPDKNVKIPHLDNYGLLAALDNVQGRFLNNYPASICTSETDPTEVTNRFIHIEQYKKVREFPIYYQAMADVLNNIVNEQTTYLPFVAIQNISTPYVQDFNGLQRVNTTYPWANDVTLAGWHAAKDDNGLFGDYRTGDGSSATTGLYSFGSINNTDRALGSLNQDASGDIAYGVLIRNTTQQRIVTVSMTYRAEQWRRANSTTVSQRVLLGYAVGASLNVSASTILNDANFTAIPAGDMVTIDNTSTSGALDGNSVFANVAVSFPVIWEPGQDLFIRFLDENVASLDKVMAIDDLTISFVAEAPVPEPPVANAATAVTASGFVAQWNTADGATTYYVDVAQDVSFSNMVPGYNNVATSNTSLAVSGLMSGTNYFYRVRAGNTTGISASSQVVSVQTLFVVPSAPVAQAASAITSNSFDANWLASAAATGYRLDVSLSSSFSTFVSGYNNLDVGNVTSISVTGLNAYTRYYYRVRAYNPAGVSGSSGTINVRTKRAGSGARVAYSGGTLEVEPDDISQEKINAVFIYDQAGALLYESRTPQEGSNRFSFLCPELAGRLIIVKIYSGAEVEIRKILLIK
jgi:hypothetical protein